MVGREFASVCPKNKSVPEESGVRHSMPWGRLAWEGNQPGSGTEPAQEGTSPGREPGGSRCPGKHTELPAELRAAAAS